MGNTAQTVVHGELNGKTRESETSGSHHALQTVTPFVRNVSSVRLNFFSETAVILDFFHSQNCDVPCECLDFENDGVAQDGSCCFPPFRHSFNDKKR